MFRKISDVSKKKKTNLRKNGHMQGKNHEHFNTQYNNRELPKKLLRKPLFNNNKKKS